MKNLFLLVMLFVSFQIVAQNAKAPKTQEQKTDAAVKRLTHTLNLTADQQPKVKEVVSDRIKKVDDIKLKYKDSKDKKAMHQELKSVRENSDKSMQEILTTEQYAQLQKIKEEKRKKAQAKKGRTVPEDSDDLLDE